MAGGVNLQNRGYKAPGLLDANDPYYLVPGHEGLQTPQQPAPDNRIWQEKVRDWGNEQANYAFGPHLDSVQGLLQFSDAADMTDAAANNQELSQALWQGRWGDAAKAAPWSAISSLAAVVPGVSAGPLDNAGRAATIGHNGGPPMVHPYDAPAGSDPRYLGAAPDRSDLTYLRYQPKKISERLDRSLAALSDMNNPVRQEMEVDIDNGLALGGGDWYNTEELRDWLIDAHGPEEGDRQWREFMADMGTTSPGSNVDANLGNASAVRRRRATDPTYEPALEGVTNLDQAGDLAKSREKGYGHKTARLQELVTGRRKQGAWQGAPEPGVAATKGSWTENPKPKGFMNSLLGNSRNIAADLHFTRYMAMAAKHPDWLNTTTDVSADFRKDVLAAHPEAAKYFGTKIVNGKEVPTFNPKKAVKEGAVDINTIANYAPIWEQMPNDNEYAAFEKFIADVGKQRGLTPAQVQAALWMGAAKRTGVHDSSQGTFMELFRRRADKRAAKIGSTRQKVIEDFVKNYGLLTAAPVVAAPAAAGLLGESGGQQEEPVY